MDKDNKDNNEEEKEEILPGYVRLGAQPTSEK